MFMQAFIIDFNWPSLAPLLLSSNECARYMWWSPAFVTMQHVPSSPVVPKCRGSRTESSDRVARPMLPSSYSSWQQDSSSASSAATTARRPSVSRTCVPRFAKFSKDALLGVPSIKCSSFMLTTTSGTPLQQQPVCTHTWIFAEGQMSMVARTGTLSSAERRRSPKKGRSCGGSASSASLGCLYDDSVSAAQSSFTELQVSAGRMTVVTGSPKPWQRADTGGFR
mmetsp:Transcript_158369/g.295321  ORF Transcript_158369/g.295321 Transcript_158369/m.295321 type:complete len:224 (+) Transcript_158369:2620-3291(+)